jgi:hypothetical protein
LLWLFLQQNRLCAKKEKRIIKNKQIYQIEYIRQISWEKLIAKNKNRIKDIRLKDPKRDGNLRANCVDN